MFHPIRRRAALSIFAAVTGFCLPLAAQGATINIILSGMDVTYFGGAAGNTGSLYDSIAHPGGDLDSTESDEVTTALFQLDMNDVGLLTSTAADRIWGDFKVDGVGSTLAPGVLHDAIGTNGGTFGFDLFTTSGDQLRLGIDTVDLLVTNNVFFFTGNASLLSQNLPFGLAFDSNEPIVFSYTATLPGLNGGPPVGGAMGSGALTISGTLIPEPATAAMFIFGGVLSIGLGFRRRRAA